LAAASDDPKQDFTFFMMADRQVNAFATVGGYIGVNAGLVLVADSEDEVAGVVGHEIAHVTQTHVLRSVERAQRDSVPILLAMLGAIAIAQSGSSSSGDAAMAAMASAQGIAAQRQINYTRSNESEADRIGIRTLARSGYDPAAMARMFERMQALERSNRGGEKERTPDYLRSHPVTTTRMAEAKQRAAGIAEDGGGFTPAFTTSGNPLLPSTLRISTAPTGGADVQFGWVRERLRVLSAHTPAAAASDPRPTQRSGALGEAQRYGQPCAPPPAGHGDAAVKALAPLRRKPPGDTWLPLAMGQAPARAGDSGGADAIFEELVGRM